MVFIEVTKGMYGLPQACLLANELLEKRLSKHGYIQSKIVPGLWKHEHGPIIFALFVDNVGVKYVECEHAEYLQKFLEEYYKVTTDWTGTHYLGIIYIGTMLSAKCASTCPATSKRLYSNSNIKLQPNRINLFRTHPSTMARNNNMPNHLPQHHELTPNPRNSSKKHAANSFSLAALLMAPSSHHSAQLAPNQPTPQ